jgi:hypothetical protein
VGCIQEGIKFKISKIYEFSQFNFAEKLFSNVATRTKHKIKISDQFRAGQESLSYAYSCGYVAEEFLRKVELGEYSGSSGARSVGYYFEKLKRHFKAKNDKCRWFITCSLYLCLVFGGKNQR